MSGLVFTIGKQNVEQTRAKAKIKSCLVRLVHVHAWDEHGRQN